MDRRNFLANALKLGLGIYFFPFAKLSAHQKGKKVVVIGIDGMDVSLTRHYMEKGFLPNLRRIAEKGGMHPMATSVPPQSPTAWSNVAVGADTAVHGIYDFIHRDPKTMSPFLSTSKVKPSSRTMHLGPYRIPLAGGGVENLRKGKPFWDYLAEFDVPSTLFKMPVNFPCLSDKINMASGMGTPDMRGGYGNFTLFTTAPEKFKEEISGGRIIRVAFKGGRAETSLPGPANTLLSSELEIPMPVRIYRDRANPVIKVNIGDNELLLQEGEWSDWIRISYPTIGKLFPIKAICKFYVQKVHAGFSMYVSPLNIDPSDPALPVVSPPAYGKQLVENVGLFYTQGFPEDTKALSEGIFSEDEYLELADQIIDERERLFRFELERFQKSDRGLFFFYVSSIDQNSHMYWRTVDAKHPLYNEEIHSRHGRTIRNFYSRIDGMLGRLLEQCDINDPNFTVMVMSDHGFSPFRRQVNLNTWLYKNGYMALSSSRISEGNHFFSQVNWRRTGAYNIGINSLYLNLKGREKKWRSLGESSFEASKGYQVGFAQAGRSSHRRKSSKPSVCRFGAGTRRKSFGPRPDSRLEQRVQNILG